MLNGEDDLEVGPLCFHFYSFTKPVHCIGVILSEMAHEHSEALMDLRASLQIKQEVLGDKHADVARTLFCIGQVLQEQEEFSRALLYFMKARVILHDALSGRNVECLRTLCHMAHIFYTRAEKLNGRIMSSIV